MRSLLRAASTASTGLPGSPNASAARAATGTLVSQKVKTPSGRITACGQRVDDRRGIHVGSPVIGAAIQCEATPSSTSCSDQ